MSSSDISLAVDGVTVVNAALLNSYRAAIAELEDGTTPAPWTPPTTSLSMNSQKWTSLANPTAANDAVNLATLRSAFFSGSGGVKNAYTASSATPSFTALTRGMLIAVQIGIATNDGASTLALDGLAPTDIKDLAGAALAGGELVLGSTYLFIYDGTVFRLIGPSEAGDIPGFDARVRTSRLDQMAAPTASVPMNAQKITGAADPTLAQDVVTLSAMRTGFRSGSGGSKNAYTASSVSPALTANTAGTLVGVQIGAATNDAASTLAMSFLDPLPIKRRDGTDVQAGDIVQGSTYLFLCDGTNWVMV